MLIGFTFSNHFVIFAVYDKRNKITIMKNLTKLFLGLLFASVIITGCKEAEEIFYVNFDANYETEFDVVVPPSGGKMGVDATFSVNETIDPTTNSDYLMYIDNIKEVDIEEVSGEVIAISKNVILQSGTISVTNNTHTATWSFTDEDVQVGTVLVLGNEDGQWDAMTEIMLGKVPFTVNIDGEVSDDDVDFTLLFKIKSVITASPIQ